MKTRNLIALAMVGLALSFTPALAQRPGGGGGNRGGGGHSSPSVSRSSSPSSSRSSSSFSSSSRSTSSSRSSSSFGSPSRSTSASRSTYSSPRSSASSSSRSSYSSPSSRSRSAYSGSSRSSATPSSRSAASSATRSTEVRSSAPTVGRGGAPAVGRGGAPASGNGGVRSGVRSGAPSTAARPGGGMRPTSNPGDRSAGYARPGRPGPLPPSNRPIHPAPYFYHPWHGYVVHCHPLFWDPLPPRPWFWPGFWLYCNSYWYDYHVTDVVVVRDYVKETYSVDMVTYGISGDVMYAIVKDGGETYLQVYDKEDHLLAEQKIHKKYCNLVIDAESGGCWISKKHDKDPLLFIWVPEEAKLLIYEAD